MQPVHRPRPKTSGKPVVVVAIVLFFAAVGLSLLAETKAGKLLVVLFDLVRTAVRNESEASSAPGVAAVRALGCDSVRVYVSEAARLHKDPLVAKARVLCHSRFDAPPSCDDVARAYRAAPGTPTEAFEVHVTKGGPEGTCTALYDSTGTRVP